MRGGSKNKEGDSGKEKTRLAFGTPECCSKIHIGLLGHPGRLFPQPHTDLSIVNYSTNSSFMVFTHIRLFSFKPLNHPVSLILPRL